MKSEPSTDVRGSIGNLTVSESCCKFAVLDGTGGRSQSAPSKWNFLRPVLKKH